MALSIKVKNWGPVWLIGPVENKDGLGAGPAWALFIKLKGWAGGAKLIDVRGLEGWAGLARPGTAEPLADTAHRGLELNIPGLRVQPRLCTKRLIACHMGGCATQKPRQLSASNASYQLTNLP